MPLIKKANDDGIAGISVTREKLEKAAHALLEAIETIEEWREYFLPDKEAIEFKKQLTTGRDACLKFRQTLYDWSLDWGIIWEGDWEEKRREAIAILEALKQSRKRLDRITNKKAALVRQYKKSGNLKTAKELLAEVEAERKTAAVERGKLERLEKEIENTYALDNSVVLRK